MEQILGWRPSGGLSEWPHLHLFIIRPLSAPQVGNIAINNCVSQHVSRNLQPNLLLSWTLSSCAAVVGHKPDMNIQTRISTLQRSVSGGRQEGILWEGSKNLC